MRHLVHSEEPQFWRAAVVQLRAARDGQSLVRCVPVGTVREEMHLVRDCLEQRALRQWRHHQQRLVLVLVFVLVRALGQARVFGTGDTAAH